MSDPVETPVDLNAQAIGRVVSQYRGSARLLAFISGLAALAQEIQDALAAIPPLDDIDVATQVNLEVTGDLVGQGRQLINGDLVTDSVYRLLIKARIARNHSHATGEDILSSLAIIFPGAAVRLFDFGGMAISYLIGVVLTADEIAALGGNTLPRPMGVRLDAAYYDPAAYFGFQDDPTAKGFSDDAIRGPGKLAEAF